MSLKRCLAVGAALIVAVLLGAMCWREATRIHTVIITVPDGDGFFAVWVRDEHPDVVKVDGGVAVFSVPQMRLLRAKSMSCLRGWHFERFVDRGGKRVDDVQGLGSMSSSSWDGDIEWWYRGPETDLMYSIEAKQAWLAKQGIE